MRTSLSFLWMRTLACVLTSWAAIHTGHSAPLITMTYPKDQSTFIAPADLAVFASVNDPERRVAWVKFFANTNQISASTTWPEWFPENPVEVGGPWFFVPVGEYTLTAVACRASGESLDTSAPVRITVEFSCESGIVIRPFASDTVVFWPEFGLLRDTSVHVGGQPSNRLDDLQSVYSKTTDNNREFRRGFVEFAIPFLPVPFSSAKLLLDMLPQAGDAHELPQAGDAHELSYYAADLIIDTNEFHQPTIPLLTFQPLPTWQWQTLAFDVTSLAAQFEGGSLGFRVKLAADPEFNEFTNFGAEFHGARLVLNTCSNPPPSVEVWASDPIAAEGPRRKDPAAFVVRRTGGTNSALTVHYSVEGSAASGLDYEALPGTVTIPAGRYFAEVPVKPLDDTLVERTEYVALKLELTPPVLDRAIRLSFPPPYLLGPARRAVAYIFDNQLWQPARAVKLKE